MKIYLAARYSRREELCAYRDQLRALGHDVQARWLDGEHPISDNGKPIGNQGEALVEGDDGGTSIQACALRSRFAQDDWEDVNAADIFICFTEPPRSAANRGGRHVEYGIALANGDRVIVVGYRENIFHWLPQIEFYETWEEAKRFVLAEPMKPPMQPESNGGVRVQRVVRRRDMGLVTRLVYVPDNAATGQLMREVRKRAGLSVREMARRLGQSAPFVSDLELGRRGWNEERIEQWAKVLLKPAACPNCKKPDMQLAIVRETKFGILQHLIHCNSCGYERNDPSPPNDQAQARPEQPKL